MDQKIIGSVLHIFGTKPEILKNLYRYLVLRSKTWSAQHVAYP
jgi:hypothetical protein